MKVLFLSNNKISNNLINWLKDVIKENVISYYEPISLESIRKINPEFVISYNYRYIIEKEVIDYMKDKIINLHISLLPWNKGAHPNVWSFLENTPKGVTIHLIDEGIDTGNILIQKEVFFDENKETLKSSYEKLHKEIQELFKRHWNEIKKSNLKPKPQHSEGSKHYKRDFKKIEHLLNDKGWDIPIIEFKNKYENLKKK